MGGCIFGHGYKDGIIVVVVVVVVIVVVVAVARARSLRFGLYVTTDGKLPPAKTMSHPVVVVGGRGVWRTLGVARWRRQSLEGMAA